MVRDPIATVSPSAAGMKRENGAAHHATVLKNETKTCALLNRDCARRPPLTRKSFLVLFLKKELLT
jgi:hypothetical protein